MKAKVILTRLAAYVLAILGVLPALAAYYFLTHFRLAYGIWFSLVAAIFWIAAFKIDRRTKP